MLSSALPALALAASETLDQYQPTQIANVQITPFNSQSASKTFVVKGNQEGAYIRTNTVGVRVLELCDGSVSLEQIRAALHERFSLTISQEKLVSFLDLCAKNHLLVHQTWRNTIDPRAPYRRKISKTVGLYKPLIRAEGLLNGLFRIKRLWWNPLTWLLLVGLMLTGIGFVALNIGQVSFASALKMLRPELMSWSLAWLPTLLVLEITAHELAHAVACRLVGAKPGGFGVGLLWWVLPVFFTDTADTYTVDNKYKRACVSAAGPLSDLVFLGAIATLILLSPAGSQAHAIGLGYIGIPLSLILFNLNPFVMRVDGYWIVTNLLEQTNLRRNTVRYFFNVVRRSVGRAPTVDPLATNQEQNSRWRWLYLLYAFVALTWTAVFIGKFVYSFFHEIFVILNIYVFR
jgi:putative peptide zinc metalloprotease protein